MSRIPWPTKRPLPAPNPSPYLGLAPSSKPPPLPAPVVAPVPEQRWENEGGHPLTRPEDQRALDLMAPLTPRGADEREDLLMKALSPDGLPPTHALRTQEWRWMLGIMPLVAVAGGVLALIYLDLKTMLGGLALLALLVCAASPVWVSALMRWREHVQVHAVAEETIIVQTGHTSPTSAEPLGQVVVRTERVSGTLARTADDGSTLSPIGPA